MHVTDAQQLAFRICQAKNYEQVLYLQLQFLPDVVFRQLVPHFLSISTGTRILVLEIYGTGITLINWH